MQFHPRSNAIDVATPLVRFERELAVGAIGTLWLGRLTAGTEAGRTVLLRRIPKDLLSAKDCDALKKVADAYSKVRHPSLVKLLGVLEQDQDLVSVSEHLDGVRLCDLMRRAIEKDAPLPATVAVRVVLDAARATLKAHRLAAESGLFPAERLFLAESVFVAAFGGTLLTETGMLSMIARFTQARAAPELLAQLAPEELEGSSAGKGSPEVFSLGTLLWELLANRYLFVRSNAQQASDELRSRQIPALDQIERCGMPVPAALAEVVRVATNRHPNQRFSNVSEFVTALEDLPAHFLATEHHVASALRDQAADLLKEFHVDESQSSLTVAFSEVPPSRHSTRPPTDGAHDWEPPTFAQRKLVNSTTLALNPTPIRSTLGIAPCVSHEPIPLVKRHAPLRRRLLLTLGVTLSVLGVSLTLAKILRSPAAPVVMPDRNADATHLTPPAPRDAPTASVAPAVPVAAARDEPLLDQIPVPAPSSMDASLIHSRGAATDASSASTLPISTKPSALRKSDSTYRPRQIAPYRPKGI